MAWNLTSSTFLAEPQPLLAQMRAAGPLVETRVPLIGRTWVTTTDAAARALLKDPRFVRDPKGATGRTMRQTLWFLPRFLSPMLDSLILKDGEDHRRLRSLVDRAFARTAIDDLVPDFVQMADSLLDSLDPARPVDLKAAYARRLPLLAICSLLGIPAADRERVTRWITPLSDPGPTTILRAMPGLWRVLRHFRADLETVRRTERAGLIRELVRAEDEGGRLSEEEVLSMVVLLFLAGHETTVHLITDSIASLLSDPQVREEALSDPARLPLAVEEFLRFHSPVMMTKMHYAREDLVFEGVPLRKGSRVSALLLAANHDPARVEAPEELHPHRRPNAHLAFGFGPHVCLGMQLARAETRVAIARFFRRFPEASLIEQPAYARRFGIRGYRRLLVRLRP
ncbi:putative cytochrome P450 hydroxylase [Rubellimicrobium mesophilum DSM 19309]|uniref:Putative cytochrome P450 hydroxylase n=1 Tax=Rubellimicrobium mesophilum DSM 19309 TaxID=442562 RepID=A0A017HKP5_9RHOB|nr:cytochrome P450 [Rubellimicrobium mesophilum]EYD74359.1 putative cytochrome P450 hydroxylase [Rubellimicrobium mesophilum DSM 19309]